MAATRRHRSLLLFIALVLLAATAAESAAAGCPDPVRGVLAHNNKLRRLHGAPRMSWSSRIAARAQRHADKCTYGHSSKAGRPTDGENIFYSYGMAFPFNGLDVCSHATQTFYEELPSYNFADPGQSLDGGEILHFTQVVWAGSTQLGCGVANCPDMQFIVCQYSLSGNIIWNGGYSLFETNVRRAACQNTTGDDWCSACSPTRPQTCTQCYQRADNGGSADPIKLDVATGKCVSTCPATRPDVSNCAGCTAGGACARCRPGWRFDSRQRCLALDCGGLYSSTCSACTAQQCTACSSGSRLRADKQGCEPVIRKRPRRGGR